MEPTDYICIWMDGDDYHATRCIVDTVTGKPIGFPLDATCLFIIEFERGHEPMLYEEAIVSEMGIDNTWP